jgi:transcriptional regulator with XRE-family HTH domain
MNSDEIYEKIESLRKAKGMTIYTLSQEAQLSHSTFYSWRKRKTMPTLEVLEKIADALGTTLAKLLFNLEAETLTGEQQKVMGLWSLLNREQKDAALAMLKSLAKQ